VTPVTNASTHNLPKNAQDIYTMYDHSLESFARAFLVLTVDSLQGNHQISENCHKMFPVVNELNE
jgi:hypothetical protein